MDISWYGQACFRIKTKSAVVVTDPYDAAYTGLKKLKLSADIVTVSHDHQDHNATSVVEGDPVVMWGPGEFEVKQVRINGMASFHDAKQGNDRGRNTIFTFIADNMRVCHLGDLGHSLTIEQIEAIGEVDVLLIPVGGVYTIGPADAVEVIAQLEPKIVIPMHFKVPNLVFDLGTADAFFKAHGQQMPAAESKLTITADKLPDTTQVMLLSQA